jgi:hypothetical protein
MGLPCRDGKIDETEGRAWIDANLDPRRREARKPTPGATPNKAYGDLQKEKIAAEIHGLLLKNDKLAGSLVSREQAERTFFARARMERDAWTGWSARTAPLVAAEVGADSGKVFIALDRLVRAHLDDLAKMPLGNLDA